MNYRDIIYTRANLIREKRFTELDGVITEIPNFDTLRSDKSFSSVGYGDAGTCAKMIYTLKEMTKGLPAEDCYSVRKFKLEYDPHTYWVYDISVIWCSAYLVECNNSHFLFIEGTPILADKEATIDIVYNFNDMKKPEVLDSWEHLDSLFSALILRLILKKDVYSKHSYVVVREDTITVGSLDQYLHISVEDLLSKNVPFQFDNLLIEFDPGLSRTYPVRKEAPSYIEQLVTEIENTGVEVSYICQGMFTYAKALGIGGSVYLHVTGSNNFDLLACKCATADWRIIKPNTNAWVDSNDRPVLCYTWHNLMCDMFKNNRAAMISAYVQIILQDKLTLENYALCLKWVKDTYGAAD